VRAESFLIGVCSASVNIYFVNTFNEISTRTASKTVRYQLPLLYNSVREAFQLVTPRVTCSTYVFVSVRQVLLHSAVSNSTTRQVIIPQRYWKCESYTKVCATQEGNCRADRDRTTGWLLIPLEWGKTAYPWFLWLFYDAPISSDLGPKTPAIYQNTVQVHQDGKSWQHRKFCRRRMYRASAITHIKPTILAWVHALPAVN
jgi:hypothetical protein